MKALRGLADRSLDRPWLAPAICVLVTLAAATGLPRLQLETDGRVLIPPGHPAIRVQERVDRVFARSDFLVVALESDRESGIYSPPVFEWIARTTRRLEDLPGVAPGEVRSLSTTVVPRWSGAGLHLEPLIDGGAVDRERLDEIRSLAEGDRLVHRVLTARDGRGAAIYVPLEPDAERRPLVHRVEEVAAEELARLQPDERSALRVHLLGPTVAESLLGEHVLSDLALLLPFALSVVALLLWLWFRWWSVVALGLAEAVVVITWVLGLMGLLSCGITLVAVVMPVILVTYCVADTIHIAERFRELYDKGEDSVEVALRRALDEVTRPVVLTSLTTAAGFLAFGLGSIPPLREFGLFSALGVVSALGVSLLVVPPALLLAARRHPPVPRRRHALAARGLGPAMAATARRPVAVLMVGLGVTLLLGLGWSRIQIQDSWLDNFSSTSDLTRSERWFNEEFLGSNLLHVVLEPPAGGSVLEPEFLGTVRGLQRRLEREEIVGGSLSVADPMATVGRVLTDDAPRLPRTLGEAKEWALLLRVAGGHRVLTPYLDDSSTTTSVWVFLNRADSRTTQTVMDAALGFLRGLGDGAPATDFAGDAYLGRTLVQLIADNQRVSVAAALLLNLLVVLIALRRLGDAVLVVLPVALAVLWNYGWMGWSGLPLGVATSTFSAIALGIGIDFALHWHETLKLRLQDGLSWERALSATGASAGGAILLNGLVLLCGLGVLFASAVPPNRRLALLVCINLLACLVVTFALLPALASLLRKRRAVQASVFAQPRQGTGAVP